MRRYMVITALILLAIILPTSIYALQTHVADQNMKEPKAVALSYLLASPTFLFDGMDSTIRVVDVVQLESLPVKYVFTIKFSCLHSGYGNRTGENLLQVITPHIAVITIVEGMAKSAVLDGVWDELNQRPIDTTQSEIEKIALQWLYNSLTFKFDGMKETVKVTEIWQAQTFAYPSFWQVTVEYDCRHAGYGDRTGQVLAQVITHHSTRIHVTEGVVNLAITDEIWDELNQKLIPTIHTAEEAEQVALTWLYLCPTFKFDGVPETVKVLKVVTLRMPNAYDIYIGFTCNYPGYGNRTGNVMLGKTQEHIIRMTVIEGKVTRAIIDEVWDEMSQALLDSNGRIISPESARDMVVVYLIKTYSPHEKFPEVWAIEDLTPKGILGYSTLRYQSDHWSLVIEYPVVLKPTYTVVVEYKSSLAYTWKGTVDPRGAIQVIEFKAK